MLKLVNKNSRINDNGIPLDIERKLNVHEVFRRRHGRILNYGCSVNKGRKFTSFIQELCNFAVATKTP